MNQAAWAKAEERLQGLLAEWQQACLPFLFFIFWLGTKKTQ